MEGGKLCEPLEEMGGGMLFKPQDEKEGGNLCKPLEEMEGGKLLEPFKVVIIIGRDQKKWKYAQSLRRDGKWIVVHVQTASR